MSNQDRQLASVSILVATWAVTVHAEGPTSSLPALLPYSRGPGMKTSACGGGDRYGLYCSVCSGGPRDGQLCYSDGSCSGSPCVASDDLCPGVDADGVAAACDWPAPWPAARFLPLHVDGGNAKSAAPTALRVTLVSVPSNPQVEGQVRWVAVPAEFPEVDASSSITGTFTAAQTACEPALFDWTALDALWIYGEEIHHEALYAVQLGDAECVDGILAGSPDDCLSAPLMIATGTCGDSMTPLRALTSVRQPGLHDFHMITDKFLTIGGAPTKPRLLCTADVIPRLELRVDLKDILRVVSTFEGAPYPLAGVADAGRCD